MFNIETCFLLDKDVIIHDSLWGRRLCFTKSFLFISVSINLSLSFCCKCIKKLEVWALAIVALMLYSWHRMKERDISIRCTDWRHKVFNKTKAVVTSLNRWFQHIFKIQSGEHDLRHLLRKIKKKYVGYYFAI